ncbi:hypothetical protein TWF569_003010 [Orbilia oligospora]|uniref:von Hippel-Lindau disease tumour suppressor beta domain-containing protein n=1 Tax=Orbilia oligospora TaxID=2813651 RepID=A0A7C8K5I5_ORBOL|nr:hypothetical protein TWF102_007060 [Orbilia oligospora]KAF3114329.1 hypothetical protein TWF706_008263 [Orbilia oligospora]KAF3117216.1 hypothetical protein TWF103_007365 [Orbilia oligospora]KAF3140265.1 hypothetical protein TWF703_003138 [Orbilia oligospora]KAF3150016.1 hypothetical protein TWF594_009922 [Orbilia oligospora]
MSSALQDPAVYLIQPVHPDNEPGSKSVSGDKATKVTFINNRASPVHVWWLNYEGKRVSYGSVAGKGGVKEQDTYVTHPWVVVDESNQSVLGIYHPGARSGRIILL